MGKLKSVGFAIGGGIIGAAAVMVGQGAELHMKPPTMSYNDWAGILLAAAALIVTAVGVVMAIAAIWGFSGIKTGAESAAVKHVSDQLSEGDLSGRLDEAFSRFLEGRLRDGALREFIEDRVNYVLFGGAAMRAESDQDEADFTDSQDETDPPATA